MCVRICTIYWRDCKIITLNTIKNKETCVSMSSWKSQTLAIEHSSSVNEKKNESFVMNEALQYLLLFITLIEEQNNHFFSVALSLSRLTVLFTIYRIISFMGFAIADYQLYGSCRDRQRKEHPKESLWWCIVIRFKRNRKKHKACI